MSKPREWWIHSTGNAYTRDVSSEFPVVHVIEYSAYEAAQTELAIQSKELADALHEIATLKAEKEKLMTSLGRMCGDT